MKNKLIRFKEGWVRFGRKMGDLQGRLMLLLFYFVILGPFSVVTKFTDPLKIKPNSSDRWHPLMERHGDLLRLSLQQF